MKVNLKIPLYSFRFVLETCRRLKEKKSYLVWTAVGCLGVPALSDLVKEVMFFSKSLMSNEYFQHHLPSRERIA